MANKSRDFLTGFMQGFNQAGGMQRVSNWAAKKSGSYDIFQDPYAMQAYSQARQIGTPAAQQEFTEQYGQYVEPEEGYSASEMFFGKENPTYMGMDKGQFLNTAAQALSSGTWDEGEFKNIMLGASEAYGEDLTNNSFLSAFMQEQPETDPISEMFSDPITNAAFQGNELAQKAMVGKYGDTLSDYYNTPEEFVNSDERASYLQNEIFSQPEEGYDYSQLDPEQLAAMVMADEQLTPEEQEVWNNSPYSPFGSPENFIPQPERERLIDLGALGLPGGEVPIDDANKLMGILNTALNYRKFNQPQGQDYGPMINGAPFGVEGQIPLKYGSDYAALIRAMNGGGGSENKDIIGKYNGRDVTLNKYGYVTYADDNSLVTNENGNYLRENPSYTPGSDVFPNPYVEVTPFGAQNQQNIEQGDGQNNYWGDYEGPDFMKGKSFSEYLSGDNTQTKSSMDNIISQFKEANPDLTYAQIAQRLSERDPVEFKQRTGLNLNAVRDRLRRMR